MKKLRFRANATEINKTPNKVRYVFVVEYTNGKVTSCMSYQTLDKVMVPDVACLKVADIWNNKIIVVYPAKLKELLEEWRENYHNFDWEIPETYRL
jgi:hypothetical protein